jgi:vancomycin permeability regulator SanA
VAAAIVFPLAQVALFGATDYRRPADVIVVFGAHAYSDGTPSVPLADRVRTACELYHQGLAPRLLFTGGPGDGVIDEPTAIQRDANGVNTEASVSNSVGLMPPGTRVLVVSHYYYHLPRIKMTYQRYGVDVYTVPAQSSPQTSNAWNVVRESAAFWRYYVRRLV